jgi:threonine dehydratase
MLDVYQEVLKAETRIRSMVRKTPLDFSLPLSKAYDLSLYLKCENLQLTGSFKLRGALNSLSSLTNKQKKAGVVVASTGNHGAAIAYGLTQLDIPGIIFIPETTSKAKIENIQNYEKPIKFYGTDSGETELFALNYAKKHNMQYISPYNHPQVIGGQGTIGMELLEQTDHIDAVFVPVGGGGLISGIAGYIKTVSPNTKIIGCLPENSPVMYESIVQGKIIKMNTLKTLSDGTAGGMEPNSITFELCQQYVDDYCLVSEDAIQKAMRALISKQC